MMSSLEIKETNGLIKDVTLAYVKADEPDFDVKTQQKTDYVVTAIVDSATGKEFAKTFPKASCTMIETTEIKQKFKIDPPNPEAPIHYAIKLRSNYMAKGDIPNTEIRKGDILPPEFTPKVFLPTEVGDVDITREKRVANGSKGNVSFRIREDSYGKSVKLNAIRVTDFIEYEGAKPGVRTNDFGEPVADNGQSHVAMNRPAPKPYQAPSTPQKPNEPYVAPTPVRASDLDL
jgi:hypothetical protein